MDQLLEQIAAKKAQLDRLRPLAPRGLSNLEHAHDLELTYTSNAIEGNTLTAAETMLVVEQGITIGGKPLKDHMEAIDHYDAIRYVRDLAREPTALTEMDVRNLHSLVVKRSAPEFAGRYADQGRYVVTDMLRGNYPPVAVRPEDRSAYISASQQAGSFDRLLYERLNATLGDYLNALKQALPGLMPKGEQPTP